MIFMLPAVYCYSPSLASHSSTPVILMG